MPCRRCSRGGSTIPGRHMVRASWPTCCLRTSWSAACRWPLTAQVGQLPHARLKRQFLSAVAAYCSCITWRAACRCPPAAQDGRLLLGSAVHMRPCRLAASGGDQMPPPAVDLLLMSIQSGATCLGNLLASVCPLTQPTPARAANTLHPGVVNTELARYLLPEQASGGSVCHLHTAACFRYTKRHAG